MRLQHSTPIFRSRPFVLVTVTVLLSIVPLMFVRVTSSIVSASWQGFALAGLGVLAVAGLFLVWHLDRRTCQRDTLVDLVGRYARQDQLLSSELS